MDTKEVFEILRVTPDDWQKYRDMRALAISDSPLAFSDSVTSTLSRTESEWRLWFDGPYVYVIKNKDIYVSSATLRLDPDDDVWCINSVWTMPEYRMLGLSKILLENIFEKAKSLNIKFLELSVTSSQDSAITMYKKLGFEIIKINIGEIVMEDKKYDEYIMRKYL